MRIFLDANILFSAAQSGSRMEIFVDLLSKHARLLTNDYAVEEARRNLDLKFPDRLSQLEKLIKRCELVPAIVIELKVDLNLKDVPILGGAVAGKATHLLTGDERDFGAFFGKVIQGVKVVSPRLLAEECVKLGFIEPDN